MHTETQQALSELNSIQQSLVNSEISCWQSYKNNLPVLAPRRDELIAQLKASGHQVRLVSAAEAFNKGITGTYAILVKEGA